MKYYTKEWHQLMLTLGTVSQFEPVIDKEYNDEEIEALYQEMMDKYVQEEHDDYDEPPVLMFDDDDDDDEFDPEDYLIGDFDEDGDEINLRHPADLEELKEYQRMEFEREMDEYENRPPFDEEEAREEFEEDYRDELENPDPDIPEWITETVDPRLIAMWVLPEKAYKRLMEEMQRMQERFDELDDAADDAIEELYANIPAEYEQIVEDLDELDDDYVISVEKSDDEVVVTTFGWDEDDEEVKRRIIMDQAEIIEDEGLQIESGYDEDGDFESNCGLEYHELYFDNDCFELHMFFSNEEHGYKYLTVRCKDISITQERA